MSNILSSYTRSTAQWWQRMSVGKKMLILSIGVFFLIFAFFVIWGLAHVQSGKMVVTESLEGKKSLEYAQVAIASQEFERAEKDLQEAKIHFAEANEQLGNFAVFRVVPGIAPQLKAADKMLIAATNVSSGLEKVARLGAEINGVIGADGDATFADITSEDKGRILKVLAESSVDLQAVESDLELAALAIEQIPDRGLLAPVREVVAPVKEQLPLLQTAITQAIPLAQSLPSIMGYPEERKYLFLLQNNNELRPTGGFIGTYGILKVKNGEITAFSTDNIYNLDDKVKTTITAPAPYPIARFLSTQNDLMRNINWDPHFPITAQKAEAKYYEESGVNENFDGVIAVTPTFIASLMTLTGPITVDGTTFESATLAETLQLKTEKLFALEGKSIEGRKEVIGQLANSLIDQLFGLPKSKLPSIWTAFVENVNQKHILLYVEDPATQQLIVKQNWAGEMKPYTVDYLAVVDANLASLKTDRLMDRTVNYSVEKDGDEYIATVNMVYTNNTKVITDFETRYNTWVRFFVPVGSTLLEHEGFMTGSKIQNGKPSDPDVGIADAPQSNGTNTQYTLIEGFTSIEPRSTGTVRIRYRLPQTVKKAIEDGSYALLVQKQAGTRAHSFNGTFDFGQSPQSVNGLDIEAKIENNKALVTGNLQVDRSLFIEL